MRKEGEKQGKCGRLSLACCKQQSDGNFEQLKVEWTSQHGARVSLPSFLSLSHYLSLIALRVETCEKAALLTALNTDNRNTNISPGHGPVSRKQIQHRTLKCIAIWNGKGFVCVSLVYEHCMCVFRCVSVSVRVHERDRVRVIEADIHNTDGSK